MSMPEAVDDSLGGSIGDDGQTESSRTSRQPTREATSPNDAARGDAIESDVQEQCGLDDVRPSEVDRSDAGDRPYGPSSVSVSLVS